MVVVVLVVLEVYPGSSLVVVVVVVSLSAGLLSPGILRISCVNSFSSSLGFCDKLVTTGILTRMQGDKCSSHMTVNSSLDLRPGFLRLTKFAF